MTEHVFLERKPAALLVANLPAIRADGKEVMSPRRGRKADGVRGPPGRMDEAGYDPGQEEKRRGKDCGQEGRQGIDLDSHCQKQHLATGRNPGDKDYGGRRDSKYCPPTQGALSCMKAS